MGNKCGSNNNPRRSEYIIISDTVKNRYFIRSDEEECENSSPEYKCLIENYKDAGGINTIVEDAITFYANSVERRCAAVTRLEGICSEFKNELHNCYYEQQDCSINCADKVEAFISCINQQYTEIVAGKIKLKQYEKKRDKIERQLSEKYKISL